MNSGEVGVAERDGIMFKAFPGSVSNDGAREKISGAPDKDSPDEAIKKIAIVLDMGEASREQGFRLNGCR